MNVGEFITYASRKISSTVGLCDTPRLDAEILLCHALDKPRAWAMTWPEKVLDNHQTMWLMALLNRRLEGEPIAYITGVQAFWTLSLKTDKTTLIPRHDTETLVEVAMDVCVGKTGTALDLGTGTGAIALAIAKEKPHWNVTGVDCMQACVMLAQENASFNNIDNTRFYQSHWFSEAGSETFSLIVSNPPYIRENDPHLNKGDVRFEPRSALVSGKDGLQDIRKIAEQSPQYLERNGWLVVEHGYDQGKQVRDIFIKNGFDKVNTHRDLAGSDRVTSGKKQHA